MIPNTRLAAATSALPVPRSWGDCERAASTEKWELDCPTGEQRAGNASDAQNDLLVGRRNAQLSRKLRPIEQGTYVTIRDIRRAVSKVRPPSCQAINDE